MGRWNEHFCLQNGQSEGRAGSRNDVLPSPSTFSTPTKSAHSSQSSSPQKYKGIVAKVRGRGIDWVGEESNEMNGLL